MNSFALYRLPYDTCCTFIGQTSGEPVELQSCAELNDRDGFVVSPFSITKEHPLLLIRPDVVETYDLEKGSSLVGNNQFHDWKLPVSLLETHSLHIGDCDPRASYASSFRLFHDQLLAGCLRKVVLSRCLVLPHEGDVNPLELFEHACRSYPRLFIALVYTPKSGLWMTATPEVLLENSGSQWHTVALAGTMRLEGDDLRGEGEQARWSAKNIEEQRVVATYLSEQLAPFAYDVCEEGPRTVRAANLVHLRSDFTFTLYNKVRVGDLLQALHPTPAVCGLPKEDAFNFIMEHEPVPRQYYSGFMGPFNLSSSTHLYVSLRCMQITDSQYRLYAGGGLLKDSVEEQEWQETEAKLETMRSLLNRK